MFKKNNEEGYKATPSEEISSFISGANGELPKKKSPEELMKDIRSTRSSAGRTTLLYRQVNLNRDLAILALIIACAALAGFLMRGFNYKEFSDYLFVTASILGCAMSVIWKMHTPPGKISKDCIKKGQKGEDEVDAWGRSVMKMD